MTKRIQLAALASVVLIGVGAAGWLVGRVTAPAHDPGFVAGNRSGYAEGVATGRALQVGDSVPQGSKAATVSAFNAGYRAGQNDSFGAYDGGWKIGVPYLVVLGHGAGGAPYLFASRTELEAGTSYRLCPDGHSICH